MEKMFLWLDRNKEDEIVLRLSRFPPVVSFIASKVAKTVSLEIALLRRPRGRPCLQSSFLTLL